MEIEGTPPESRIESFDTLEVVDASVFIEAMFESEKTQEAKKLLYDLRKSPTRLPATTHSALGEVIDVLRTEEHIQGRSEKTRSAIRTFRSVYDCDNFLLLTPSTDKIYNAIKELLERKNSFKKDTTDCLILATSIANNADKLHTLDEKWRFKGLIDVEDVG